MNGYVIEARLDNPESNEPLYWNDSFFTEDITRSHFFTNIIEARQVVGNLQSQYLDRDMTIVPAKNGIYLSK